MFNHTKVHHGSHVICDKNTGAIHLRVRNLTLKDTDDVKYYTRKHITRVYSNVFDGHILFSRCFGSETYTCCRVSPRSYDSTVMINDPCVFSFAFAINHVLWFTEINHNSGVFNVYAVTLLPDPLFSDTLRFVPNKSPDVYSTIHFVDYNRCILYVYVNQEHWFSYDLRQLKQLDTSYITITAKNREIINITIDRDSNFWVLFTNRCDSTYCLEVYDEHTNLIKCCALTISSLFHWFDNRYFLRRDRRKIYGIVHHPTMNKLFIMTLGCRIYEINVAGLRWDVRLFSRMSLHTQRIILTFELLTEYSFFHLPVELRQIIYSFLMEALDRVLDVTGNDRRITASGELIENHEMVK